MHIKISLEGVHRFTRLPEGSTVHKKFRSPARSGNVSYCCLYLAKWVVLFPTHFVLYVSQTFIDPLCMPGTVLDAEVQK